MLLKTSPELCSLRKIITARVLYGDMIGCRVVGSTVVVLGFTSLSTGITPGFRCYGSSCQYVLEMAG